MVPSSAPARSAPRMPIQMGRPSPPACAIRRPPATDVTAIPKPGVRSMPPVAMTKESPRAWIPVTTDASNSEEMLLQLAKLEFITLKNTTSRMRTSTTIPCWMKAL